MTNILEIKNLDVFFKNEQDDLQVLHNINLNLEEGKLHALVGESGCGKTITAMSVMKLLPQKAYIKNGEIIFNGKNLADLKTSEIRALRGNQIALIPQNPMTSLNPLYTIGNQLIETIQNHSRVSFKQAKRKAIQVMQMVKIPEPEKKLNYYPHEFSGGMQQRIIIAMALSCNAQLIIADEPTTALDVTIQKEIMDLLTEIKNEFKTTILLISHDLALVSNYADYITVMYCGYIVEQAEKNDFFKNTLHPYSKALLNSLPTINPKLKLETIQATPPTINEKIDGCKFHPRCKMCELNLCNTQIPELKEYQQGHFVSCLKI